MRLRQYVALIIGLVATGSAYSADVSLSGFGTIGYAQSDKDYNYQRFINKNGTLKTDSLLGLQTDIKFNEYWSATWQGVVAASDNDDDRIELRTRWAFLAYRPSNDWLLRVGKLRVGSFLNMQNMEVGSTYDMARLPAEVYSVAPLYDFNGLSATKTWYASDLEINLEGVYGKTDATWRNYLAGSKQANFTPLEVEVKGLMLTLNQNEDMYRLGWYYATPKVTGSNAFPSRIDVIPNNPAIPNNPLAGMGGDLLVPSYVRQTEAMVVTLGANIALGDYRLNGEYARRVVDKIDTGPDSHGAYLSLSRNIGKWTPYITYAKMWSDSRELNQYRAINAARLPSTGGFMPAVDAGIAANYQDAASSIYVYDQQSWMLGTAYRLSATQKIKAEVMQTHIGETSALIDGAVSNQDMLVYSLSYSFAF